MISIILPYWKRNDLLLRAIKRYEEFYHPREIELIIIDDGSNDLSEIKSKIPFKIVSLEKKENAMNPCVPINEGVKEANGDFILLSNPEIRHIKPILSTMLRELKKVGEKGYISAACWDRDRLKWFAHTSLTHSENVRLGRGRMPRDSSFHFCTLIYKSFYKEIGGFDEVYREGQAFEDNDFLWTLEKNNAIFKTLDNCVVHHFNTKTKWPVGGHERNRKIFEEKWKHKI